MKINDLHDKLFDVLCIVDDICQQENVRWFLDGGTAIGAVREKDFIPWDDDVDIKVLAEDYPAFKAAMEKHLPEHLHFIEPDAFAPHFYDFIARIYDDRWLLRSETPEDTFYGNLQNRVGTDVFVLYRAPAARWRQKLLVLETKILYGLGMAHRYRIKDEKYTPLQKAQVAVLHTCGRAFSAQNIFAAFRRAMRRWQGKTTGWRYPANYPLADLQVFPDSWYATVSQGEIRGRKFPLAGNIDAELTAMYGDYMHPPRDPDRYVHHLAPEDMVRPPAATRS